MDTVEADPEMVRVQAAHEIALEGSVINQIAVQQLRTSGPAAETRFISLSFVKNSTFQVAELVRAEKISPFQHLPLRHTGHKIFYSPVEIRELRPS